MPKTPYRSDPFVDLILAALSLFSNECHKFILFLASSFTSKIYECQINYFLDFNKKCVSLVLAINLNAY